MLDNLCNCQYPSDSRNVVSYSLRKMRLSWSEAVLTGGPIAWKIRAGGATFCGYHVFLKAINFTKLANGLMQRLALLKQFVATLRTSNLDSALSLSQNLFNTRRLKIFRRNSNKSGTLPWNEERRLQIKVRECPKQVKFYKTNVEWNT